jgi:hypothetical protein
MLSGMVVIVIVVVGCGAGLVQSRKLTLRRCILSF